MFEIILHEEAGYPAWLSKEAVSILKGVGIAANILFGLITTDVGLLINTFIHHLIFYSLQNRMS